MIYLVLLSFKHSSIIYQALIKPAGCVLDVCLIMLNEHWNLYTCTGLMSARLALVDESL